MSEDIHVRNCFVALFDILGFSDLIVRNELGKVYNTYMKVRYDFSNKYNKINKLANAFKTGTISFHSFSDTFLMYKSGTEDIDFKQIYAACDFLFMAAN